MTKIISLISFKLLRGMINLSKVFCFDLSEESSAVLVLWSGAWLLLWIKVASTGSTDHVTRKCFC